MSDQPTPDQHALDQSTVDQPTVDQPTVDQSTVDQSTVDQPSLEEPALDEPTPRKMKRIRRRTRGAKKGQQQQATDASPEAEASSSTPATTEHAFVPATSSTSFVPPGLGLFLPQLQQHETASFSHSPSIFNTGSATQPNIDFKAKYDQEILLRTIAEAERDEALRARDQKEDEVAEARRAKKHAEAMSAKAMDSEKIIRQRHAEASHLQRELAEAQQEIVERKDELRIVQLEELKETKKALEEMRAREAAADQRNNERFQELQDQIENKAREAADQGYNEQFQELRDQNQKKEEAIDGLSNQVQDLGRQLQERDEAVDGYVQLLEDVQRSSDEQMREQAHDFKKQVDDLRAEVVANKKAHGQQITALKNDLEREEGKRVKAESQYQAQERDIENLEEHLQKLQTENSELQVQLTQKDTDIKAQKRELEVSTVSIQEANNEVDTVLTEKEELRADNDKLKKEAQGMEREVEERSKMIAGLFNQMKEARELALALEKESQEKQAKLEELQQEQDDLQKDNAAMQVELGKFVSQSRELDDAIRQSTEHLALLAERDEELRRLRALVSHCRQTHGGELPDPDEMPEEVGPVSVEDLLASPGKRRTLGEELKDVDSSEEEEVEEGWELSRAPLHTILDQPGSTAVHMVHEDPPRRRRSSPRAAAQPQDGKTFAWVSATIVVVLAVVQTALTWRERQRWLAANVDTQGLLRATLAGQGEGTFAASFSTLVGSMLGLSELEMAEARSLLY